MGPGENGIGEDVVDEEDMLGGIEAMVGGATVVGKAGPGFGCDGTPLVGKAGKKVSKSRNLRD